MKKIFSLICLFILIIGLLMALGPGKYPKGWFPAGSNPNEYEMGVKELNGSNCAFIKSKSPKQNQFGTLMQTIKAEKYLGKRIKLTAKIKTDDVQEWAGLWMRIDGNNYAQLGFDNMENRPIQGNTDWKKYSIVLDIPENSQTINYGVLLSEDGIVYFDDLVIEVVDKNTPVTNMRSKFEYPAEPVNLNFEN